MASFASYILVRNFSVIGKLFIFSLMCISDSVQFRAESIHDMSQSMTERCYHSSTTRSPSFHGELFRLRNSPEADESLSSLAKVAVQHKRHSFGLGNFFFFLESHVHILSSIVLDYVHLAKLLLSCSACL